MSRCSRCSGSVCVHWDVHVSLQIGVPRPLPFLLKVLVDVGRGLLSARAARVLHMDVKAANVVVDWEGPDSTVYVPCM